MQESEPPSNINLSKSPIHNIPPKWKSERGARFAVVGSLHIIRFILIGGLEAVKGISLFFFSLYSFINIKQTVVSTALPTIAKRSEND